MCASKYTEFPVSLIRCMLLAKHLARGAFLSGATIAKTTLHVEKGKELKEADRGTGHGRCLRRRQQFGHTGGVAPRFQDEARRSLATHSVSRCADQQPRHLLNDHSNFAL
jgi:hypothetical protein